MNAMTLVTNSDSCIIDGQFDSLITGDNGETGDKCDSIEICDTGDVNDSCQNNDGSDSCE